MSELHNDCDGGQCVACSPGHEYGMSLTRANEINRAMVDFFMAGQVLDHHPEYQDRARASMKILADLSLRDMLAADEIVRAQENEKLPDGTTVCQMKCDHRLIAAIYTMLNFSPSPVRPGLFAGPAGDEIILSIKQGGHYFFLTTGSRKASEIETDDGKDEEPE